MQLASGRGESTQGVCVKKHEADVLQMSGCGERFESGGHGDMGSVGDRISVDAGGDSRERNGFESMLVGEADRFAMTARQGFGLSVLAVAIDRADGVDNVFCGKMAARGDNGLAGGKAADFADDLFALSEDGRATGAVNGAIDASAAEERGVSGVDDSVCSLARDVGRAVERDGFGVGEKEAHGKSRNECKEGDGRRQSREPEQAQGRV